MFVSQFPKLLVTLHFEDETLVSVDLKECEEGFCWRQRGAGDPAPYVTWMERYAKGKSQPLPFEVDGVTSFQGTVFEALRHIPFGKTLSYQALAQKAGSPRAARAVGGVMRSNRYPLFYPCHRVLASGGGLGGFSCGLEIKKRLLAHESGTAIA